MTLFLAAAEAAACVIDDVFGEKVRIFHRVESDFGSPDPDQGNPFFEVTAVVTKEPIVLPLINDGAKAQQLGRVTGDQIRIQIRKSAFASHSYWPMSGDVIERLNGERFRVGMVAQADVSLDIFCHVD